MPLINCGVSLTLTWSENYVLTDITTKTGRAAQGDNPAREGINAPTNVIFKKKSRHKVICSSCYFINKT